LGKSANARLTRSIVALKDWARAIKRDILAIFIAARDARTPWYGRAAAFIVAGYALSPIDLIPDFIPILGYVDELLLLPGAIALIVRMIPPELMAEFRVRTHRTRTHRAGRTAAIIIVLIWAATAGGGVWLASRWSSAAAVTASFACQGDLA
jgi:uncharacterized membrane protein YkvA (DUF1232 family)